MDKKLNKTELEIVASPSQTSNICFFATNITMLPQKAECRSASEAEGSALFTKLFELPWVQEVAVDENKLVVKKKAEGQWPAFAKEVGQILRQLHAENIPFFSPEFIQKAPPVTGAKDSSDAARALNINLPNVSSPLGRKIQKMLTEQIGPGLAAHGGTVTLVDIKEGEAYLYFGGGCQGCSQAAVTVKDGIEQLLLKYIPEITKVVDVTEHNLGTNPFYK